MLTIEPWRVCRAAVANFHHNTQKQDPDPHQSDPSDADPQHGLISILPHKKDKTKRRKETKAGNASTDVFITLAVSFS
jgi:hypothetical protein